jgi:hypothetical protein
MCLAVITCERCNNLNGVTWWIEVRLDTTIHILVALTFTYILLFMTTARILVIDEITTKSPN